MDLVNSLRDHIYLIKKIVQSRFKKLRGNFYICVMPLGGRYVHTKVYYAVLVGVCTQGSAHRRQTLSDVFRGHGKETLRQRHDDVVIHFGLHKLAVGGG